MESKGFFLAAIFAAVMCISGSVFAALSGDGTEASPYLIQSRADFDEFANPANGGIYWASGKYTRLMCDPNLAGTTYTQAVIAPDTNSSTSGFQGTQFTGVFDGNGHTISNLTINQPTKDYIGLFGYIGTNGQVKNLGVLNTNVNGRNYVGGLTGNNSGTISSCYATGAVSGKDKVGGLAGWNNSGTISFCYATGAVTGTYSYVGGLAGFNYNGTITSCYATGAVNGTGTNSSYVGGLAGYNDNGTITSCYATGAVSGTSYVGGLAGFNYNGTITSCYATGTVTGYSSVGGLAGSNSGTISSCYATGAVSGTGTNPSYVGGLAGYNDGTITSCYATGAVSGTSGVGGLVGRNNGTTTSCYATGAVSGSNWVGGLVGHFFSGTITSCYATGAVSGTSNVGGLVGYNYRGTISFCYATGTVSGTSNFGGLTGDNYSGWITFCFWDKDTSGQTTSVGGMGKTTAQMKNIQTYLDAGWLFIEENRTLGDWVMPENNYPQLAWQVYTPVVAPNLKGLTEQQAADALVAAGLLQGQSYCVYDTSVAAGLVSVTIPQSGTTVYAGITRVSILLAKDTKYTGGDGVTEPYRIETVEHLLDMSNSPADWSKWFILTADINLAGLAFVQTLIAPDTDSSSSSFQGTQFTGIFDGNGHTISNLTITALRKDYIGLFGTIGSGGQVKNLGIINAAIQGRDCVGDLAGYNISGTINSCYATGAVSGNYIVGGLAGGNSQSTIVSCYATGAVTGISDSVGGLVGHNSSGTIISCYAMGTVSGGDHDVGGLAGSSFGTITSCYATGAVSGVNHVGGLAGRIFSGTITFCYATGAVSGIYNVGGLAGYNEGTITSCFWDKDTSGQTTSHGGIGKTTAKMKTLSTFTAPPSNWDFTTTDGDVADWMMLRENEDYPRLTWQEIFAGDIAGLYGVDMADLMEVVNNWLQQGCPAGCEQADIDNSGTVDLADLSILAANWMLGK